MTLIACLNDDPDCYAAPVVEQSIVSSLSLCVSVCKEISAQRVIRRNLLSIIVRQRQTLTVINKRPWLILRRTTFDRRRWPVCHANCPPLYVTRCALSSVYTMQPVAQPVHKLIVQPVVSCKLGVSSASRGPSALADTCTCSCSS